MRLIAYYLPQYHEIPENNEWWEEGFTEWTNVKKAKSLFKGHDQPIVPGELGYYDLNEPSIRERQAEMAKHAGIEAFCYWHYWFGDGKQLLEMPLAEVLSSKSPDFKFCLGWANESWKAKVWSESPSENDTVLIEQKYPGENDITKHFYHLLNAFKDYRYLKVDGKPLFVIYKPFNMPNIQQFFTLWNNLAIENGIKGIFFVGYTDFSWQVKSILKMGFNAVNVVRLGNCKRSKKLFFLNFFNVIKYLLSLAPLVYNYKNAITELIGKENKEIDVFPSIIPNWDTTPRSGIHGFVMHNSKPKYFLRHIKQVFNSVSLKPKEKQIIFVKSWNEWGEGNYLEPNQKYGTKYLDILRSQVLQQNNSENSQLQK